MADILRPSQAAASSLLWTCSSVDELTRVFRQRGVRISVSHATRLLRELGFQLWTNRWTQAIGMSFADREGQFKRVEARVEQFLRNGEPVIWVDALGSVSRHASSLHEQELKLARVDDHEQIRDGLCLSRPSWQRTMRIDQATTHFAGRVVAYYWREFIAKFYPRTSQLLILTDGGGRRAKRCRDWRVGLEPLGKLIPVLMHVCHFPPGIFRWKGIEHRILVRKDLPEKYAERITQVSVGLIAGNGKKKRPRGRRRHKIDEAVLASLRRSKDGFVDAWNYMILPT